MQVLIQNFGLTLGILTKTLCTRVGILTNFFLKSLNPHLCSTASPWGKILTGALLPTEKCFWVEKMQKEASAP
jgi:hypothetical protein